MQVFFNFKDNKKGKPMFNYLYKTYAVCLFLVLIFVASVNGKENNTYARKSYVTAYNIDLENGIESIDFVTETGHHWENVPTSVHYNVGQEVLVTFDRNGTMKTVKDDYVVLINTHNVGRVGK